MPFFGVPIRNGLPIGLGSVAGFGVQQFDPSLLFEGGTVPGTWYDPSDLTTMFTTSAGTTPVAMPGGGAAVSVGRMLDKSGNGNHAIAINDTTARPELRARVNLLTYSEQFDNAAWNKAAGVTVTPNTDIAPDGTLTADTVTSGANQIDQSASVATNTLYTDSLYLKKTSGAAYQPGLYLLFTGGTLVVYAVRLNTDTGVATAVSAGGFTAPASFSVTDAGNYWKLSITGNSNNNTTGGLRLYPNLSAGGGAGAGSQIIWGADLRPANIGAAVPAYQRIADANTYDTAGFPLYLRFDGIDDGMYTPANLDLSNTAQVGVFAGVRKLSDAAYGVIAETSADAAANNGAFYQMVATASRWEIQLRGTASAASALSTYAVPITNVLSTQYDIGASGVANEIVPRVNATTPTRTNFGSDCGAGNFGTYPLYIGSRNNASLWLQGQVYGLVIVGSAVSAGNISATENWMAGKTGLVLP